MWNSMSLRSRLFLVLTLLVIITSAGGSVMMWYTHRMDQLFKTIIDWDVAALLAAEALENALINQKGFVSYYFLDGNPEWLKKLDEYRRAFKESLRRVRELAQSADNRERVDRIEAKYVEYIKDKDRVIALYQAGDRAAGVELHSQVRAHFFTIMDLCKGYKESHNERINLTLMKIHAEAGRLRAVALGAICTAILLGALLAFILVTQILNPLRGLAGAGDGSPDKKRSSDEVEAVKERVHTLMEDVDQTKIQLERSQEYLLQSEKMALVGRLAAGVAHSIRNPLTSVKMRLFSLDRSLDLSATQEEDFDVISEEIRHIDNIVQNFLEFSRPPRLKMQKTSPSDVVDMAIQLLRHRLESYDAAVKVDRRHRLPEIVADPEQLKEVFVNLIVNACEAMGIGGRIRIFEEEKTMESGSRTVVIRVSDNGPGVPEAIQNKLFQPFFSTKEEGTGLGLSIAERIVREHGGRLELMSQEGQGATFIISLPREEEQRWAQS
jgi:signal transduction histidine kinase